MLARTSNTMFNRSGKNRYLCLVPNLRGNTFNLSPLSVLTGFLTDVLYQVEIICLPSFLVFLSERVLDIANAFSKSIELIMFFHPLFYKYGVLH